MQINKPPTVAGMSASSFAHSESSRVKCLEDLKGRSTNLTCQSQFSCHGEFCVACENKRANQLS